MKPICVPCQRFFRAVKTGFRFTEGMPTGAWPGTAYTLPRGTEGEPWWKPYKLWMGDKYRCDGCGAEIVSGFACEPVAEHFQPGFDDTRVGGGFDQLQVNDC